MANSPDVELRTRALAKSWGVVLPEHATFSVAVLMMMEHLASQQAGILRELQRVHAEQTQFAALLKERPRR